MDFIDIPSILGARWGGGLLVNDPSDNEFTFDWNAIELSYCDGGSFTGSNDNVTYGSFNGTDNLPLYYRGQRNWDAVVADLSLRWGMDKATEVILSGDSAGGLATYHHVDNLQMQLPHARVVGAPDSGYFYRDVTYPSWNAALGWVAAAMNSTSGLNVACVNGQTAAGQNPLDCIFPEVVSPYIQAPLFVMNSRFDPALDDITGGEGGSNVSNVQRLGDQLLSLVNATVLSRPNTAAFLTSCHQHCGQWGSGQGAPVPDFNVTIDGFGAIAAIQEWYVSLPSATWPLGTEGRRLAEEKERKRQGQGQAEVAARRLWVQEANYPCATCCEGGQK